MLSMLFICSFLVVVVPLVGYVFCVKRSVRFRCSSGLLFSLAFMPHVAGIICMAMIWLAFIEDWKLELAMSLEYAVVSLVIIYLLSLMAWLGIALILGITRNPDL